MSYYDVQGNLVQEKHIENFSEDSILKVGDVIPDSNGEIYTQQMLTAEIAYAKEACNNNCNTPLGFDENGEFCLDINNSKIMCDKDDAKNDMLIQNIQYYKNTCNEMCETPIMVDENDYTEYFLV